LIRHGGKRRSIHAGIENGVGDEGARGTQLCAEFVADGVGDGGGVVVH
jgi:hypothetical protein